jgi:hypothetical protein
LLEREIDEMREKFTKERESINGKVSDLEKLL